MTTLIPIMEQNQFDSLFQLIRDVSLKVDNIANNQVTRHEFDALTGRIDNMVLKSEFDTYKQITEARNRQQQTEWDSQFHEVVPRDEHDKVWQSETARYTNHESRLSRLESRAGKWPPWLVNLGIALIAAVAGGMSSTWLFHAQTALLGH